MLFQLKKSKTASQQQQQQDHVAVVSVSGSLSHSEACRVADAALSSAAAGEAPAVVVVDMKNVAEATTSAFARLVLLRRLLLKTGRDLRLANLRDRAMSLYQINRLGSVLPCM